MPKRYFNIAGPCFEKKHYMVHASERGGGEILDFIDKEYYFVIHAARQSGKTTLLLQMIDYINRDKKYYALYCSLEAVQEFKEPEKGIPEIVNRIKTSIKEQGLPDGFAKEADYSDVSGVLKSSLVDYCRLLDKPLVIFFDETDCLSNGTLITFLRQLREGFVSRNMVPFVHSIALVGMRNIRDLTNERVSWSCLHEHDRANEETEGYRTRSDTLHYKAKIRPDSDTLGSASPFNIVSKSVSLPNFTCDNIAELFITHTVLTKQLTEKQAIAYIFEQTKGQPWLVNAIAREIVEDILKEDYSKSITRDMVETAIQNLILQRPTHFDSLLERLKEPRVRKVIEPLILGGETEDEFSDDYLYVRDLGLIREENDNTIPANPIYTEIIIRFLSANPQKSILKNYKDYTIPRYLKTEGSNCKIDIDFLLRDFQNFWRENGEIWVNRYDEDIYQYKEAAPHLVLQAFLQRVTNGGAQINREMALGTRRADLCIIYNDQKYPIEIKLMQNHKTIPEGLEQTFNYMQKCGADQGWLVVFDRGTEKSWDEKIYMRPEEYKGKHIIIVGT